VMSFPMHHESAYHAYRFILVEKSLNSRKDPNEGG